MAPDINLSEKTLLNLSNDFDSDPQRPAQHFELSSVVLELGRFSSLKSILYSSNLEGPAIAEVMATHDPYCNRFRACCIAVIGHNSFSFDRIDCFGSRLTASTGRSFSCIQPFSEGLLGNHHQALCRQSGCFCIRHSLIHECWFGLRIGRWGPMKHRCPELFRRF